LTAKAILAGSCGAAVLFAGTALAANGVRQIFAREYYRTFSHTNPVLDHIRPGEIVFTRTLDSGGQDEKSEHRSQPSNPLTGPFYIDGAEPGDELSVHFRKVRLNRNWGYSAWRLALISLTPEYVEKIYSSKYKADLIRKGRDNIVPWDIDLTRATVHLREPASQRLPLEFPARPMLGCVGVAAPEDFSPTSGPAGSYGGNLDYNEIGEGATVIFPVYHRGGLLFMGDGHALMPDGEPTGTGIETSMDVEFSVSLRKNVKLSGPRVETAEYLISVGAQPEFESSLDRALQLATTDMVNWLTTDYQLEPWAAHMLIGSIGKYDVVTVQGTMALKIPKRYVPARTTPTTP
jgi:amidase